MDKPRISALKLFLLEANLKPTRIHSPTSSNTSKSYNREYSNNSSTWASTRNSSQIKARRGSFNTKSLSTNFSTLAAKVHRMYRPFRIDPILYFATRPNHHIPCSLQNLFGAFGNQQQFGDYVSDAGMQGILDRLFRQHQGYVTHSTGNCPRIRKFTNERCDSLLLFLNSSQVSASKTIFDKLAKKKFTKEDASGECAICKCDWAENDEGVELPCHHVFHEDCIGQWFKSSNQCPMCRFEVETDDPEYEKVRKEKLAEQELNNILRTSSSTAVPSTTSTDSTATPSSSAAPPTSESTASTSSSNSTSQASSALTRDEREALLDEVISICSDDSSSMDLSTEYVSCDDSSQPISISSHSPIGTPVETRRATKKKKERDPSSEVD